MSNDDPSSWLMKVSLIIWTPQLHEFFLTVVSAAAAMVREAGGVRWNSMVDDEVTAESIEPSSLSLEMLVFQDDFNPASSKHLYMHL
ncbi:hypothetical protein HN873_032943, partial [Arachis hypogaea]